MHDCRSTELRLACSPDDQSHMIIREPAQCMYIIVLYLPSLCSVPAYQSPNVHITHDRAEL